MGLSHIRKVGNLDHIFRVFVPVQTFHATQRVDISFSGRKLLLRLVSFYYQVGLIVNHVIVLALFSSAQVVKTAWIVDLNGLVWFDKFFLTAMFVKFYFISVSIDLEIDLIVLTSLGHWFGLEKVFIVGFS